MHPYVQTGLARLIPFVFLVMGCAQGVVPLPVAPRDADPPCIGMGFTAIVHGSQTDLGHPVWVEARGSRVEVEWPLGFAVRFAQEVEVLDSIGRVVAREGDDLHVINTHGYHVGCIRDGTIHVSKARLGASV